MHYFAHLGVNRNLCYAISLFNNAGIANKDKLILLFMFRIILNFYQICFLKIENKSIHYVLHLPALETTSYSSVKKESHFLYLRLDNFKMLP